MQEAADAFNVEVEAEVVEVAAGVFTSGVWDGMGICVGGAEGVGVRNGAFVEVEVGRGVSEAKKAVVGVGIGVDV